MLPPSTDAESQADAEDGGDKPPHVVNLKSNSMSTLKPPRFPQKFDSSNHINGARLSPDSRITSPSTVGGPITPPSMDSPVGTASDSDGAVSPAPSRTPSRAPSVSLKPIGRDANHKKPASAALAPSEAGSQKFHFKDILGGQSLVRRTSNRSVASSRRSDSERGGSSVADSSTSLARKYGVCDKIAIGKGATSVVRVVHKWDRSEEKLYAVKEFRKRRKNETEKEYVKKLTAEFCISSTLHHTNIVETVDLVQDEQLRWCEVMEYCPGGDLYAAIKKGGMSTSEIECCFKQMLSGLEYLHSQGVAHRDIKPENLFFDAKGYLKIGDYGASTVYRLPWETTVHLSTGLCGSEPYIAPEQFSGKPYDARLVDVWACGIVYYCMQFQELPWRVAQSSDPLFTAYAQASTKSDSVSSSFPPTLNSLQPRPCRQVLRKILDPDVKKRWNVTQIMEHAWMQGIEVCVNAEKPSHVHSHANSMLQLHAERQA